MTDRFYNQELQIIPKTGMFAGAQGKIISDKMSNIGALTFLILFVKNFLNLKF